MNIPSVQHLVSPEEWQLRVDLAACYRLVAMHGWSDLVFTHISARIPGPEHHFLINPYGLMFDEITASSLVKVDKDCNKLIESPFPVNPAGFVIHSAVHAAREDAHCVIHTHTRAGVAVSAQKCGVLPISQQSTFVLASLAYHDYEGVAFRDEESCACRTTWAAPISSCCATTACLPAAAPSRTPSSACTSSSPPARYSWPRRREANWCRCIRRSCRAWPNRCACRPAAWAAPSCGRR